jgi:hypothetical protein
VSGKPKDASLENLRGLIVDVIHEVRDLDGDLSGIQVVFTNGSSLVFTVWTDWSLVAEEREDSTLPEHFWPSSDFSVEDFVLLSPRRPLGPLAGVFVVDEIGTRMGAKIQVGDEFFQIRSYEGQICLDRT